MTRGRPTKYTPELVDYILSKVETCNVGLKKLCESDDKLPHFETILEWRSRYDSFSDRYLLARRKQAHLLAEQVKDIAEETHKYIYEDPKTGAACIDPGMIALQKMRISSNTWLASRIEPKIYGAQKQVEESSPADTLTKIQALVADLNKTNTSDI